MEVAGWVASPLVEKLLNEGFARLGVGAEKKLQKLRITILPVLKSVIEEAEGSEHQSEVEEWLQRLKDAYDDAEDALDLLNYHHLEQKVAGAASSSVCQGIITRVSRPFHSIQEELRSCLKELEETANEAEKFRCWLGVLPDKRVAVFDSRQTISLPPLKVFGRDEDREKIIQLLKTEPAAAGYSGSTGIPVIAIVGRPGIGKTTLAQYVCEQLRSESGNKHFHPIMWVYASRNFNASEIMKSIIEQASIISGRQDHGNLGIIDELEVLHQKMNKKLRVKKFLLVIDNFLCDREDHKKNWDTLLRSLSKCLRGSKILVTSQTNDAPRRIGATRENIYRLEELEENDFLDLVIRHALPSGEVDSCLREELAEKCKTIAKKLNKDPTAAEMVGQTIAIKVADLLQSQDDLNAYLSTIAQKDWSGDNTQALMWSYRHLPAHLQRCFSYCSLYPRGYKFKALELVKLWMAQGFIKPDDQKERMEDVGNGYLNELVSRFYIQDHNSYYTLHELLYDLAEKVSRNDCVRIEGNRQSQIPSTIRHLCIPANKLNDNKEEICELKKLRTLIVTKVESVTSEENVATYVFKSLKKLRVLVSEINLENLAEFISEMKHLRVLRVSGTREFVLPESVCTLYQLQVLEVENASSLPKLLTNLVSLRYLQAKSYLISAIPDIGKLTSLQGLEDFQVRRREPPKKEEPGAAIASASPDWLPMAENVVLEQLQSLNELRGCLRIANLENVKSKESAIAANLKEKKYLDILQLVWFDRLKYARSFNEDNVDAEILEGLQLPPNLTGLSLDGYRGRSCPSWPEYQTRNIQELALRRCEMLEELPLMDQIFPSCRSLELSHLPKLKALHALPPQLTTLIIENTPSLIFVTKEDLQMSPAEKRSIIEVMRKSTREWFTHQHQKFLDDDAREMMEFIAAMNDCNSEASSSKRKDVRKRLLKCRKRRTPVSWERWLEMHELKMELIYSRQNEARLHLPSTLTGLQLKGCNITNHALSACLQTLTSLTYLLLAEIRTVTCLPSEDVLGKLKALQYLSLAECWALSSLGGIGSLPHLKELCLSGGFPCLDSETAFLQSSLEIITFASCADVDVVLANAELPCLSDLTITGCHMRTASLQFGNLPSLRSLDISHCRGSFSADLQELRSLELLDLLNCSNLQEVMNFPGSLKHLRISECPILERSINIDPCSPVLMLSGIPEEDMFGRPLIGEEEERFDDPVVIYHTKLFGNVPSTNHDSSQCNVFLFLFLFLFSLSFFLFFEIWLS